VRDALTVLLAFATSTLLTRWFIDWLAARALLAVENDRTMHIGAIPQGGGAPVMITTLAVTLLLWPWTPALECVVPLAVGLAALSAANDRQDIAFPVRLAAHMAAASVMLLALVPSNRLLLGGFVPWGIDRVIVVVAIAWFINLYNFMDGIDGITGVETVSITGGYLLIQAASPNSGDGGLHGLALAALGASLGFLVWNWHRARIFLGDVGSIPLGLLMGALMLQTALTAGPAPALILPLYYLIDATGTLARRWQRGEKVWQAHRTHAYQRAARAIGSHDRIVFEIAVCNGVLVACALAAIQSPWLGLAMAAWAVALLLARLEWHAAHPAAGRSSI
jgi:UDP-N-acetylmuramyl pentapeptide phosphotransferase/UDP-N-acetylglucosamine-1-phosphate transferase